MPSAAAATVRLFATSGTDPIRADVGDILAEVGARVRAERKLAGIQGPGLELELTSNAPGLRPRLLELARVSGSDVLVHAGGPPPSPRWVVFDGDATLLQGETIDELARRAGVLEDVSAVTRRAMEGELEFENALSERLSWLTGLESEDLEAVRQAMPLSPGARATIRTLRRAGSRVAVASGGFHFLLDAVARQLGLDRVLANRLELQAGRLTGRLLPPLVDAAAKARFVRDLVHHEGTARERTVAVGDGANDAPMLAAAGVGIAYQAKPILLGVAAGAIYRGGLTGLIDLLQLRPPHAPEALGDRDGD